MKVKTKFYGEVEVGTEERLHFPEGLPGFETDQGDRLYCGVAIRGLSRL